MIYFVFLYQIIEIKKNIEKCKRKITKIKKSKEVYMENKEINLTLSYNEMVIVKEVFQNFVRTNQNINFELGKIKEIENYLEILKKIENGLNQELKIPTERQED